MGQRQITLMRSAQPDAPQQFRIGSFVVYELLYEDRRVAVKGQHPAYIPSGRGRGLDTREEMIAWVAHTTKPERFKNDIP